MASTPLVPNFKKHISTMSILNSTLDENKSLFRKYPELSDGINYLKISNETFRKLGHDFGLGKTSLWLAEFYLETIYGTPINLNLDL